MRIPEKLIRHLLKPNDAKIGDFWDTNRKYIKDKGFTGEKEVKPFYLLLSRYDGDIEQAVVELIDLRNFNVIYKWNPNINKFHELIGFPGTSISACKKMIPFEFLEQAFQLVKNEFL